MSTQFPEIHPVGRVESTLTDRAKAPNQGYLGAPDAWLVFEPGVSEAMRDLAEGEEILVLTWLHQSDRTIQVVHPQDNPANPQRGVFSTRSEARPNPIGIHRAKILEVDGLRVRVEPLEAVDGTPIVDVKPVLDPDDR